MNSIRLFCLGFTALLLAACTGLPEGVTPVDNLDADEYLGRWYEIARLDHGFEEGLSQVTATYSLNEDGSIKVINRGYDVEKGEWSEAEGRAKFVGERNVGHLKVSFFGPFYASYVIFKLDSEAYQYAYVTGNDRGYLWLLARTPTVSDARKADFVTTAEALGYAVDDLIWVEQSQE